MSWNARRFARLTADRTPRDAEPLCIWLSRDALGRLSADGGYLPDPAVAAELVQEALSAHTMVCIGLADSVPWTDGVDGDGTHAHAEVERIITCLPQAAREAHAQKLAEGFIIRSRREDIETLGPFAFGEAGGETLAVDGTPLGHWGHCVGDGDGPDLLAGSVLGTVAAALRMFADPDARADAACTSTTEAVQVMKPAKARRARVSPTRDVHVIDVRRSAPREGSAGDGDRRAVEHDHRWAVRGHWRNQACGKGRAERRRIWIADHVAGPEDKPLRRDARVYRVA